MYISSFLKILWNSPEIMHRILVNSDEKAVQTNLAPLLVNNFYCNLLSGNYMDNNLLYIFTMMLKDEIDKLENINDVESFLEGTKCGFLLEELIKMPDIQIFFKNVIRKTVEKIERKYSFREIKFDIEEISKELTKYKNDEEKKNNRKSRDTNKDLEEFYNKIINGQVRESCINYSGDENNEKYKERNENFIKNYEPNITSKDFESRAEEAKSKNKENLYNYFKKLENDTQSNNSKDLYSNLTLKNKLEKTNMYNILVSIYQNDFLEVISFLEQLIEDLMKKMLLLPNSIKYICKIIYILIKNKFKNITTIQLNAFISRFIIEKLLIPIISIPNFNALISDFVISGITVKNIEILNHILKKLFSGKLFLNNLKEGEYTPFNWFFIDKMENILDFFEKTTNVNLPNFIEKYINNNLPEDYSYEYFTENKEDFYANISICFTNDNIHYLLKGLPENDKFFSENNPIAAKIQKLYKKLKPEDFKSKKEVEEGNKKEHIRNQSMTDSTWKSFGIRDSMKNNDKNLDKKVNQVEEYYIYNDKIIEEKCENLFHINNLIANFYIDIKKDENLDEKQKNVIKVKNYLSNSLGNYRLLNRQDFSVESTFSTIKMLDEIKTYMFLPNFILNNNTIPSIWYMNSLLDYLNKIPKDYKENDFQKLFNELTRNLKESINNLDFEKLIQFRNKLKFIDKIYNYYEEVKKLINNIVINENIKHIVEEAFIPVDIIFVYSDKEKKFDLMKSNKKDKKFEDKLIYEASKKKITSFRTIEAFTRFFPNIAKYQFFQHISPLDIIKELGINDKINDYFKIIKDKIIKKELLEKTKYENLYEEKIKNYIMNKLYEKIYPSEPTELDEKIKKKMLSLSWVEPHHQIFRKDYIFDNMLPDILNEYKQINIVKTPYQKLNCINTIYKSIFNLVKFNEGIDKEIGADEITPVLSYISIKAQPDKIFTDIDFIKLFTENYGQNIISLTQIENIYNAMMNYSYNNFSLTPEEYDKKCKDAYKDNENDEFNYNFSY